jgi:hypothetical protein
MSNMFKVYDEIMTRKFKQWCQEDRGKSMIMPKALY